MGRGTDYRLISIYAMKGLTQAQTRALKAPESEAIVARRREEWKRRRGQVPRPPPRPPKQS